MQFLTPHSKMNDVALSNMNAPKTQSRPRVRKLNHVSYLRGGHTRINLKKKLQVRAAHKHSTMFYSPLVFLTSFKGKEGNVSEGNVLIKMIVRYFLFINLVFTEIQNILFHPGPDKVKQFDFLFCSAASLIIRFKQLNWAWNFKKNSLTVCSLENLLKKKKYLCISETTKAWTHRAAGAAESGQNFLHI